MCNFQSQMPIILSANNNPLLYHISTKKKKKNKSSENLLSEIIKSVDKEFISFLID